MKAYMQHFVQHLTSRQKDTPTSCYEPRYEIAKTLHIDPCHETKNTNLRFLTIQIKGFC